MTPTYITWLKDEFELVNPVYEIVTGESLGVGLENETHASAGSWNITQEQVETLQANPLFANVTFSNQLPEGM